MAEVSSLPSEGANATPGASEGPTRRRRPERGAPATCARSLGSQSRKDRVPAGTRSHCITLPPASKPDHRDKAEGSSGAMYQGPPESARPPAPPLPKQERGRRRRLGTGSECAQDGHRPAPPRLAGRTSPRRSPVRQTRSPPTEPARPKRQNGECDPGGTRRESQGQAGLGTPAPGRPAQVPGAAPQRAAAPPLPARPAAPRPAPRPPPGPAAAHTYGAWPLRSVAALAQGARPALPEAGVRDSSREQPTLGPAPARSACAPRGQSRRPAETT